MTHTRTHAYTQRQDPACIPPESWVRARLIEAVPCPGSLMERWYQCQAANNQVRSRCCCCCCVLCCVCFGHACAYFGCRLLLRTTFSNHLEPTTHLWPHRRRHNSPQLCAPQKDKCLDLEGCSWTDWVHYTSLPLPSHHKRRLLAPPDAARPAPRDGPAAAEAGGCQLSEVLERRVNDEWDGLSNLAFQISHLDPAVWGSCSTVDELKDLVPPAARANCSSAKTAAVCGVGAPLCRWDGAKSECVDGCAGLGKEQCGGLKGRCKWAAEPGTSAGGACVKDLKMPASAAASAAASWYDDLEDLTPATNSSYSSYRAAQRIAACEKAGKKAGCAADAALKEAAIALVAVTSRDAAAGKAGSGELLTLPGARAAAAPAPKNGAGARHHAAAALAAVVGGTVAAAVLAL